MEVEFYFTAECFLSLHMLSMLLREFVSTRPALLSIFNGNSMKAKGKRLHIKLFIAQKLLSDDDANGKSNLPPMIAAHSIIQCINISP